MSKIYSVISICFSIMVGLSPGILTAQSFPENEGGKENQKEYEEAEKQRRQYIENLNRNNLTGKSFLENQRKVGMNGARSAFKTQNDWQFMGPANQSGRIMGIGVSAQNNKLWYCGADGGGVWKSEDEGNSWIPLTDHLTSLRISALYLCPMDDQYLLAGTHEGLILRTTDGGKNWKEIALSNATYMYDITMNPKNYAEVWTVSEGGLSYSADSGQSFTKVIGTGRGLSICINPINPLTMYYTENSQYTTYLYKSVDGGKHWKVLKKVPAGYYGNMKVDLCDSKPNVLYLSVADSNTIYRSNDSGFTWTATQTQPYLNSYTRGFDYIAVSPTDPDLVFTGSTSIYRTNDGGKTWLSAKDINDGVHVDQHSFLFPASMPNGFIATNDGGIFLTEDNSETPLKWTPKNNSLITLQVYNIAIHPQSLDTIVVGCQDNGYCKFEKDLNKWRVIGGDGFCTIYDYEDPSYFYHEYCYSNLHRASNGFNWWSKKTMDGLPTTSDFYTGITSPDKVDWFGQGVRQSPKDAKTLYLGTNHLYKTTNRAENWTKLLDVEFARNASDFITTISISESDPTIIYAGTYYGNLYKIRDSAGIASSQNITPSFSGSRIRNIAIDPRHPDTLYVVGDQGWQNAGVMISKDGGNTWKIVSNGLAKGATNRIAFLPDNPKVLLLGHSNGLYYTTDAGENWQKFIDFPNVEVWDFTFSHVGSSLTFAAGTHGRGVILANDFIIPGMNSTIANSDPRTIQNVMVYPQPTNGKMQIKFNLQKPGPLSVSIYDSGRIVAEVYNGVATNTNQSISLDPTKFPQLKSGVYILEIRSGKESKRRSVVILK